MMTFTLGRSENNDFTFDEKTISSLHAKISIEEDNVFLIEDCESTNGTFVNSKRINKTQIHLKDDLVLGGKSINVEQLINQTKLKHNKLKTDFRKEFKKILATFKEYQKKYDKISNPSKTPLIIRASLGLTVLLILVFWKGLIPDNDIRYALMMSVGLISVFANLFSKSNVKKNKAIDLLRLEYEDLLKCPKCNLSLIHRSLTYWEGRKGCSKCNARYKS